MSDEERVPSGGVLRPERMQTLVDGVFAVAMTLLVLDVHAPTLRRGVLVIGSLPWYRMLLYAISFVVLGIYWVGHHNQFPYIKRTDRTLLWINILFLLTVAFIPFSTDLLGLYPRQRVAVVVYGANLIATGLGLYLQWWYATSNGRLSDGAVDPHIVRLATRRILIPPAAYLVAIALAFVNPVLSLAIYVVMPLLYIMPSRIDRHFLPGAHPDQEHDAVARAQGPQRAPGKPE